MLVAKALNTKTRILSKDDMVADALKLMEWLNVEKLPVLDEETRKLAGQVTRAKLYEAESEESAIAELELEEPVKIFNNQHLFHAIRLMLQHDMGLLPVVTEEWEFQGIIKKSQVLELLGKMLNLQGYGSVITVELNQRDFSLSEIVQLIEAEGAKILGITVETPDAESNTFEISIKLNLQEVSRVAAALRRYGYIILTEAESESYNIDLETRADELLRYLDI